MKVPGVTYVQGVNSYVDRDGMKYAIAIHNTSNNASDTAEASYATRRTDGVSSHFYCDKDSVTQSLDTNARAGHAGSNTGNENAISVEITGANGWSRATWLSNVAWGELGRVLAYVCRSYGIAVRRASVAEMKANPKVKAFYSHDDMRQAWGGTDHTDPGPNFPWDRLFQAVSDALGGNTVADSAAVAATHDRVFTLLKGPVESPYPEKPTYLMTQFATLNAKVDSLGSVLQAIVDALAAGSGNLDVAALMAKLEATEASLKEELRDAVADLGEGGAAQVRQDA